jgi:outer membrane protein assembly factor BamB
MRFLPSLLALVLLAWGCAGDPGPGGPPKGTGTPEAGSDWPGFLGPTGDGVSPEKGLIVPWPKGGPRLLWHERLGSGYGAPSVSRGRLYVGDRVRDRVRLRCLDARNGEPVWTFDYVTRYRDYFNYEGGPRCCPVVDGDRVYLYGADGLLLCVGAVDGKERWRVNTQKRFHVVQNFFGVASTPVVEGDLLLVVVGGSPPGSDPDDFAALRGDGSGLVAFDKCTGEVRYQATDELAGYASPVLAAVGGRRWCFLFTRGGLVGLDPATGTVDFRFPWRARTLESVNAANPVVVGDRVFISECYGPGSALLEARPGSCQAVWTDRNRPRSKSMQCHWSTPIHVDGYLYGCSGRHEGEAELRCVELATGKVMWRQLGMGRTSLLMVDGHFICLGEDGVLRLLKVNPRKYEQVSESRPREGDTELLGEPCWAAPVLSHGRLYVRGPDRLVCLEVMAAKR